MSLNKINNAYRVRDAMVSIAESVVERMRPAPRQATVQSVDLVNRTCVVNYPGESVDVTIFCGSIMPAGPGAVIRIAGPIGARYLDGIISGSVDVA